MHHSLLNSKLFTMKGPPLLKDSVSLWPCKIISFSMLKFAVVADIRRGLFLVFFAFPDTDSLFFATLSGGENKVFAFAFTTIPRYCIFWVGYKLHFLKFISKLYSCRREIIESGPINISSTVFSKIRRSSKNINTRIIESLNTDIGSFINLVKTRTIFLALKPY